MSVYIKLMQSRIALQTKELKKSGHNKFAGYNYFELGDFLPTVQNIFCELKLCGVISFGTDLATLTITDMEDGSQIVITSPMSSAALKGCHEVQNLGAVQTYIRRYLWVTAMEIVEHDALDATTGSKTGSKTDGNTPKTVHPPSQSITPISGALDALDPEEQAFLREQAGEIIAYVTDGNFDKAKEITDSLDNEEKLGLWSLLDSKTRSALKKHNEALKQAA